MKDPRYIGTTVIKSMSDFVNMSKIFDKQVFFFFFNRKALKSLVILSILYILGAFANLANLVASPAPEASPSNSSIGNTDSTSKIKVVLAQLQNILHFFVSNSPFISTGVKIVTNISIVNKKSIKKSKYSHILYSPSSTKLNLKGTNVATYKISII